jgi:stage V sporulation protein SpoVS
MLDVEARPLRALWASVALHALREHKLMIEAARRREAIASVLRKRGKAANGQSVGAYTVEQEIAHARRYLHGKDFRLVCDMAGFYIDPDKALQRVIDAGDESWRGLENGTKN